MLTPAEATELLTVKMLPKQENERSTLLRLDRYFHGEFDLGWMPRQARPEYRLMLTKARMHFLRLVVRTIRQRLYVDGFRVTATEGSDAQAWSLWQANSMDARQSMVHTDALVYGSAYVTVWPDPELGARIAGESPLAMTVTTAIDDPNRVEYAVKTATIDVERIAVLYDNSCAYRFQVDRSSAQWVLVDIVEHNLGITPVVPILNDPDLLGRKSSEIEELLPIQDRINETLADRMMAQKFAAFRQRWATGLVIPEDDDGQPVEPFNSAVDRLWIAEDTDVKFGEFSDTPLSPYLDAVDADVRHMAALAQVPAAYLLGSIDNVSADAITAAEAGLMARVEDKQATYGEAWEQVMRLALAAAGDSGAATDLASEVIWRDTETRSPAVLVDTLTKLRSIGVPLEFLLERYGLTPQGIERVMDMAGREAITSARAQASAFGLSVNGNDLT